MASESFETPTQEGVVELFREVARSDKMRKEHPEVVELLDDEALDTVIAAAWRCQFDDDRSDFMRAIRELLNYVTSTRPAGS